MKINIDATPEVITAMEALPALASKASKRLVLKQLAAILLQGYHPKTTTTISACNISLEALALVSAYARNEPTLFDDPEAIHIATKQMLVLGLRGHIHREAIKWQNGEKHPPIGDLVNAGTARILQRLHEYRPSSNAKGPTYSMLPAWLSMVLSSFFAEFVSSSTNSVKVPEQRRRKVNKARKMSKVTGKSLQEEMVNQGIPEQETVTILGAKNPTEEVAMDLAVEQLDPEQQLIQEQLHHRLALATGTLDLLEWQVIRLSFGMEGDELTDAQVARRLKLSPEQVQNIRQKALKALRDEIDGEEQ